MNPENRSKLAERVIMAAEAALAAPEQCQSGYGRRAGHLGLQP